MSRFSRSAEYRAAQLGAASNNQASDELIRVRPFKDDGGIDTAIEWFESVHPSHSDLSGKRSVPRAAEIIYDGEQISFRYLPCSDDFHWFLTRLRHKYPDSDVRREEADLIHIDEGDYVAGGEWTLRKHRWWPIRRRDLEGFREDDPYETVLGDIVDDAVKAGGATGREPIRSVIQVMFRPTTRNWQTGNLLTTNLTELYYHLNGVYTIHDLAETKREKETADATEIGNVLDRRAKEKAFDVMIRHLSVGDDKEAVKHHAEAVGASFASYYNSKTEQAFIVEPSSSPNALAETMARREWSGEKMLLTSLEIAPIVHLPPADISIAQLDRRQTKRGEEVPVGSHEHSGYITGEKDA
ncbi:hypothetical protein [Haladaptatus halobius]|uniref:hypothetical protein n=1 Tax=Haladaptatus halobius TaxID=2884875 RepID=UPI001D0BDF00|nr:hypothetical protein [Haladaptatus halobius]